MPFATRPPETDLIVPLPGDDRWDPHTIHTHYFGFSVPEAQLGAFLYVRYQPAFPLSQGGVCIFSGLDNHAVLDMAFLDYEVTMPWPDIDGARITTANGLTIEFLEPGRVARVTYRSRDGRAWFDIVQTAISPLARGHVMPGEEEHHAAGTAPGGSEQFMHCVGELVLDGERHAVDCYAPRDRSWRQVRTEQQGGAVAMPPIGWSPMCFGDDLIFNQISIEGPDTDPAWKETYDVPDGRPTHHFAWLYDGGDVREIVRVRRNVLAYHPVLHMALRQEIEAEAADGAVYRFAGDAIAASPIPAWPNAAFFDSVFRWEDERGRVTHSTYQEIWFDKYQRAMRERARTTAHA